MGLLTRQQTLVHVNRNSLSRVMTDQGCRHPTSCTSKPAATTPSRAKQPSSSLSNACWPEPKVTLFRGRRTGSQSEALGLIFGAGEAVSAMASVMKACSCSRRVVCHDKSRSPMRPNCSRRLPQHAQIPACSCRSKHRCSRQPRIAMDAVSSSSTVLASTGSHGAVLVGAPSNDEATPSQHSAPV